MGSLTGTQKYSFSRRDYLKAVLQDQLEMLNSRPVSYQNIEQTRWNFSAKSRLTSESHFCCSFSKIIWNVQLMVICSSYIYGVSSMSYCERMCPHQFQLPFIDFCLHLASWLDVCSAAMLSSANWQLIKIPLGEITGFSGFELAFH